MGVWNLLMYKLILICKETNFIFLFRSNENDKNLEWSFYSG